MDTVALVENQINDGRKLVDRLTDDGFILSAACWVKPVEEDRWSLYIATPVVDQMGTPAAYRQVLGALRSSEPIWITSSDIKLVSGNHLLVQDALDVLRRSYGGTPPWSHRSMFGGLPTEEVFVYSLTPVKITIYGMTFREEPTAALHLSFEQHNPHSALMIENHPYPAEIGMDWVVAAPEGAKIERSSRPAKLVWHDLQGKVRRSTPNEILSFATEGLHGFRIIHEPSFTENAS